jgi:hypothetical protein
MSSLLGSVGFDTEYNPPFWTRATNVGSGVGIDIDIYNGKSKG